MTDATFNIPTPAIQACGMVPHKLTANQIASVRHNPQCRRSWGMPTAFKKQRLRGSPTEIYKWMKSFNNGDVNRIL